MKKCTIHTCIKINYIMKKDNTTRNKLYEINVKENRNQQDKNTET